MGNLQYLLENKTKWAILLPVSRVEGKEEQIYEIYIICNPLL